MTRIELAALADIRGYAAAGRISFTTHARTRMVQRNVKPGDVRSALVAAVACKGQPDGTWKVAGPDMDGDALDLVVVLEGGVLIVTVF
ncbi:MAG: DUF4258 domain-containing protein [Polyangiaceae bacterium]|nr:DUF4258 domain-containing protein [Polyangiaceae bacterium]